MITVLIFLLALWLSLALAADKHSMMLSLKFWAITAITGWLLVGAMLVIMLELCR